jgi:hypothetical protein
MEAICLNFNNTILLSYSLSFYREIYIAPMNHEGMALSVTDQVEVSFIQAYHRHQPHASKWDEPLPMSSTGQNRYDLMTIEHKCTHPYPFTLPPVPFNIKIHWNCHPPVLLTELDPSSANKKVFPRIPWR